MRLTLKPYGEKAILACRLNDAERETLSAVLQVSRPEHCLEYVQGFDSVLFIFKQSVSITELSSWLAGIDSAEQAFKEDVVHDVPVVYDGPDLEQVARRVRLSVQEVVELHSTPIYTVRMIGFTPGFPYLEGLDARLHLPRQDSPRTRIEPGTVAIGGSHAGIYSVASPGGWHLLGRTDFALFHPQAAAVPNPSAREIFTLSTGDRLKFIPAS